ncbi:aminotransferase class IV family protein [Pseudoalteromonas sp. Of7M-16]|uniref:aminotransferase class IV family protein n=1 Tax=Pseudoalteromonas sp. Of7M-16 TaxID=2917756 RepID=UPI001EF4CE80|nr:aminotransferase class IV family protein [Pseudoalteromonas sp. Of7M-16]MCG7550665.1 aminotransferase class IV family protein [Pseudoalteromonas sp. Of7M-16]
MKNQDVVQQVFINGRRQPNSETNPLAFAGFAHFSAMQVRNGKVKGVDLHLERLRLASRTLFGKSLNDAQLLSYIREAITNSSDDCSLTVTLYSTHGEFTTRSMNTYPSVLVSTSAPSNGPQGPLRLTTIPHERHLPEIKHVGEIGKTYYLHKAKSLGFDDALFIDKQGRISEGTIWNVAFWDGNHVIWPSAAMLKGTMMSMLQRQLTKLNMPQRTTQLTLDELSSFTGAVVMNSWTPAVSVKGIDSESFEQSDTLKNLLHRAYEAETAKDV